MASVYQKISDNLNAVRGTAFDPVIAARDMNLTPAGRMMLQDRPRNFTQLFASFVNAYRAIWTWNPGPRTPSGGQVLDGVSMYGQCASLARALALLAKCPTPYGLGLSDTDVEVVAYKGLNNVGFVSPHDRVHYSLDRNVIVPNSAPAQLADLYYWENHYVVKYLGRYFDPSYDTEYTTLDEMAEYELCPGTIERNDGVYEKATGPRREVVYFKQTRQKVGNANVAAEGPFAALP